MDKRFQRKKSEVIEMALTEFNEPEYTKMVREEGEAKGRVEGITEKRDMGIKSSSNR